MSSSPNMSASPSAINHTSQAIRTRTQAKLQGSKTEEKQMYATF